MPNCSGQTEKSWNQCCAKAHNLKLEESRVLFSQPRRHCFLLVFSAVFVPGWVHNPVETVCWYNSILDDSLPISCGNLGIQTTTFCYLLLPKIFQSPKFCACHNLQVFGSYRGGILWTNPFQDPKILRYSSRHWGCIYLGFRFPRTPKCVGHQLRTTTLHSPASVSRN